MTFLDKILPKQLNYLIVEDYTRHIFDVLNGFTLSKDEATDERTATKAIRHKLLKEGIQVDNKDKKIIFQKENFGKWIFYIDIEGVMDDNVPVGIEVKLAKQLLNKKNRKEIYRMLGQSFMYKYANYKSLFSCLMMVIIIGDKDTFEKPEMKFLLNCIEELSMEHLYIFIK